MVYRKETVAKRLTKLREYYSQLSLVLEGISFEDYIKDYQKRYCIERLCYVIAENTLDILEHILVSKFLVDSFSYEELVQNSYEKGILNKDLYTQLQGLGGFRNILAHEYLRVDDRQVFENAKKMLRVIPEVIGVFEGWV